MTNTWIQAKALISPTIWERNIIHLEPFFFYTICFSFACHSSSKFQIPPQTIYIYMFKYKVLVSIRLVIFSLLGYRNTSGFSSDLTGSVHRTVSLGCSSFSQVCEVIQMWPRLFHFFLPDLAGQSEHRQEQQQCQNWIHVIISCQTPLTFLALRLSVPSYKTIFVITLQQNKRI